MQANTIWPTNCGGGNDTCVVTFETGSDGDAIRKCDSAENVNGGSIGCIETNGTVTCSCIDEGCNKDRNTAENSAEETINKLDVLMRALEERKKDLEGHQQMGNRTEEQHQTNATTEGQENANMTVLANPEAISTNIDQYIQNNIEEIIKRLCQ